MKDKKIKVSKKGLKKYPKQNVVVPTDAGVITMDNINYPVLGIDELGNQQIMQPNQNYQFATNNILEIPIMENGGKIHIKESKKGTFTKAAKKRGKSVQEFASQVLANKDEYSTAMVRKANFAKNSKKFKRQDGGIIDDIDPTTLSDYQIPEYTQIESINIQEPVYNPDLSMSLGKYYYDKGQQPTIYTPEGQKKYYEEPINNKGSFNPNFNIAPLTTNKYFNRGINYLNQGLNNISNIGTNDFQPSNYFGEVGTPIINNTQITNKPVKTKGVIKQNGGKIKYQNGNQININPQPNNMDYNNYGLFPTTQYLPPNTEDNQFYNPEKINNSTFNFNNSGLKTGLQGLSAATNFTQSGINFGKGTLDIIGSNIQNRQAQQQEAELNRQSIISQNMNIAPYEFNGYNWQGRNQLAENGLQIKEIGSNGLPNVEVEGGEHIMLNNGFSQTIQGKKHSEGGIDLNLENGAKIFSEKLKTMNDKGKKVSYAKEAKKFETKKDFDMLNSKSGNDIQKSTANMMINQKKLKLEELFNKQQMEKISGIHGDKVQKETIQEQFVFQNGGQKSDNNPPLAGTKSIGKDNFKGNLDSVYNMAKAMGYKGTKDITSLQKWATNKNPAEIASYMELVKPNNKALDLWRQKGLSKNDKDFNWAALTPQERVDAFNDGLWDYRFPLNIGEKPNFNIKQNQPNIQIPTQATPVSEIKFTDRDKYTQPNISPNLNLGIPIPNVYGRQPLNFYTLDAQHIDPRYLDIQPQVNDITRNQRAFQNNIGSRTTSDMSNLLQSQVNTNNALNQLYGQKYNYDRGQDAQAQQFNAQSNMNTNQYNQQSWFNQLENPIRQREGILDTQVRTDNQASIENMQKQQAFYNNLNYINNTFNPYQNMTSEQIAAMAFATNPSFNTSKKEEKKYGGKIKMKMNLKKKK